MGTPALTPTLNVLPTFNPIEISTPGPIDSVWYQGWWTCVNPTYGFSLLLPPDWVVDEFTSSNPQMNGHLLNLHMVPMVDHSLNCASPSATGVKISHSGQPVLAKVILFLYPAGKSLVNWSAVSSWFVPLVKLMRSIIKEPTVRAQISN